MEFYPHTPHPPPTILAWYTGDTGAILPSENKTADIFRAISSKTDAAESDPSVRHKKTETLRQASKWDRRQRETALEGWGEVRKPSDTHQSIVS